MKIARLGAFVAAGATVLLLCSAAVGAETTREEYTAAVEPICKANTEANERILQGVRGEVRNGKLKAAAARLAKASTALKGTLGELRAVPKPAADGARLDKWLGYVKQEAELFAKVSKQLKAGQKGPAQRTVEDLTRTANRANVTVLPFNFRYCVLQPSRFT